MLISVLFSFFFLSSRLETPVCDCANAKPTFKESIDSFTADLEVVHIDTISKFGPNQHLLIYTKLRVRKLWNGAEGVQEVWMYNASGTDCQRGLYPDSIGQRFIMTGHLYEHDVLASHIPNVQNPPFLYLSLCAKPVLDVIDGQVYGVITASKQKAIYERYQVLQSESQALADAYYDEIYSDPKHPDRVQGMPMQQFDAELSLWIQERK